MGGGRECLLCKQALSLVMVEKKVPHGQKMIEVRLRFWTNAIAKKKDHIVPKHCWDHGTLYLIENEGHEVKHPTGGRFERGRVGSEVGCLC